MPLVPDHRGAHRLRESPAQAIGTDIPPTPRAGSDESGRGFGRGNAHAAGMLVPVDDDGLIPPPGSQTAPASRARKAIQDPVVWYLSSAASASGVRYLWPPGSLPSSWTTTKVVPIRTSTLSLSSVAEPEVMLLLT